MNEKTLQEPVKVYVWTDIVCPYCIIGEKLIKEAIDGLDAELVWMPFELRPHPTPTLKPEDDYLQRAWRTGVYPTAEKNGIDIKLPTVSPQPYTRLAFIGMQYAQEKGTANAYVEALLSAFFQHDKDVGNIAVLKDIAVSVGLSAEEFEAALSSTIYINQYDKLKTLPQRLGINSVPSVLIGDQLFAGISDQNSIRNAVLNARGKQLSL